VTVSPDEQARSLKQWSAKHWGVLVTMSVASIIIVMDGSIVNVAIPSLARAFDGASNASLQWIVDAYVLTFATLLLTAGACADRFGRRTIFAVGLLVFAVTSVGAATSRSAGELTFWRSLMGVGASMIFPCTLAILTDVFRGPRERQIAIAVWAGSSGIGIAVGPVAAGIVLVHLHWGWIFLINIPVVLLALAGTAVCVPESRNAAGTRIDLPGTLLSSLGIFALVLGIIEAPERGWMSGFTGAALGVGALLLGAFFVQERRSTHSIFDVDCFRRGHFGEACLALAIAFFGLFGFVFLVTQYFQFIQGLDALHAGLRTLPFALFIVCGAVAAAVLPRLVGMTITMAVGLLVMSCGFIWTSFTQLSTPYSTMLAEMFLLGVGLGIVNASGTDAIMAALPSSQAGAGSSINDTLRELGGTLGVACMGSAFNSLYRAGVDSRLGESPLPAEAQSLVRASVGAAAVVVERVSGVAGPVAAAQLQHEVGMAFCSGFCVASRIAACVAVCGACVLCGVAVRRRLQKVQVVSAIG